jgi:hypothetical protein
MVPGDAHPYLVPSNYIENPRSALSGGFVFQIIDGDVLSSVNDELVNRLELFWVFGSQCMDG